MATYITLLRWTQQGAAKVGNVHTETLKAWTEDEFRKIVSSL